jgi:hypothetical protein
MRFVGLPELTWVHHCARDRRHNREVTPCFVQSARPLLIETQFDLAITGAILPLWLADG